MNRVCNYQGNNFIRLYNRGGLVLNLTVKYTHCGQVYTFDSGSFTLGFSREISLPKDATNIQVSAQAAIYVHLWDQIFYKTYPTARTVCLLAWGIIGCSPCVEIPCPSPITCKFNNSPMFYK